MSESERPYKATDPDCRRSYLVRCLDCENDHETPLHPSDAGPSGVKVRCPECEKATIHALTNHVDCGRVDERDAW